MPTHPIQRSSLKLEPSCRKATGTPETRSRSRTTISHLSTFVPHPSHQYIRVHPRSLWRTMVRDTCQSTRTRYVWSMELHRSVCRAVGSGRSSRGCCGRTPEGVWMSEGSTFQLSRLQKRNSECMLKYENPVPLSLSCFCALCSTAQVKLCHVRSRILPLAFPYQASCLP